MFSVTSNAPNLERLTSEMGLDNGFRLFWIQMPTLWNIYKVTILVYYVEILLQEEL